MIGNWKTNNQLYECSNEKCNKFFRWYQAKSFNIFSNWDNSYSYGLPNCPHCNTTNPTLLKDTKESKKHSKLPRLNYFEFRKRKKTEKQVKLKQEQEKFNRKLKLQ